MTQSHTATFSANLGDHIAGHPVWQAGYAGAAGGGNSKKKQRGGRGCAASRQPGGGGYQKKKQRGGLGCSRSQPGGGRKKKIRRT